MTPDVFLAASKRVVGNIRWRSKPNRHDSGWQFFFVALLDVAVGEVIPRASVRGNYRASVDGMEAIVNLSLLLGQERVYGVDLGGSSHVGRVQDDSGAITLLDAGRYHEHRWEGGRSRCFALPESDRNLQGAWDRLLVTCNIERVLLPDPASNVPGQMGLEL